MPNNNIIIRQGHSALFTRVSTPHGPQGYTTSLAKAGDLRRGRSRYYNIGIYTTGRYLPPYVPSPIARI